MNSVKVCDELQSALVGKQLTGVVFVHDYVQLLFDESEPYDDVILNIYSKSWITNKNGEFSSDRAGYRDSLCALIGGSVASLDGSLNEQFSIALDTGNSLTISLQEQDFTGPEAAYFVKRDNLMIVFP